MWPDDRDELLDIVLLIGDNDNEKPCDGRAGCLMSSHVQQQNCEP